MPSVLPGFEPALPAGRYDIFISYRHNDNRSGWVTEFVNALQEELAATIKEPLSIYFDKNLHDGLLEIHNVDKSLEGKLKCLIFIPIISQTYCDPKSFAWQHEFCAFNRMCNEDAPLSSREGMRLESALAGVRSGLDVKLHNGNVASRILPIKIHDLDAEDTSLIESEIGGALRPIEFIFKSPGVNRPLTSTDKREENSNKTFYRDQVNKVANAIKEITIALKQPASKSKAGNTFPGIVKEVDLEKSIAVLPFRDMSSTKDQEYLADGLAEEILNSLVHVKELKVTGRTSSFQFKGQNIGIKEISEKLQVRTVLEGSVRKQGNWIRITVELINASDGFHLWSERYDRELDDIFAIQDDIASNIAEHLKLTFFGDSKLVGANEQTRNAEAYDMLLRGRFFLEKRAEGLSQAMACFQKALELDPDYADVHVHMGYIYFILTAFLAMPFIQGFETARQFARRALELDPDNQEGHHLMAWLYYWHEWDWHKAETEYKKIKGYADFVPRSIHFYAMFKAFVYGDFDFAIAEVKKQIAADPVNPDHHMTLVQMYCYGRYYEQSTELATKLLQDNPTNSEAYRYMGLSYFFDGKYEPAVVYFRKAAEIQLGIGYSTQDLIRGLIKVGKKSEAMDIISKIEAEGKSYLLAPTAWSRIYSHMGDLDKAFEWLEEAFKQKDFWLISLKHSQDWDDMKDDPRFTKMLKRMNFPE